MPHWLVPPTKSVVPITEENVLADHNITTIIIRYYKEKHIVKRSRTWAQSFFDTMISSIIDVRVLNISNNIIKLDVKYEWENDGSQFRGRGVDQGIATLEKTDSTYKVLEFQTGGMTY